MMSEHNDLDSNNSFIPQRAFSYPYGYTSALASVIALVALILSMSSTFRCDFIKVNIVDKQQSLFGSYDEDHWYSFGLWIREEEETPGLCLEYNENERNALFDSKWGTARVSSIMADVFAVISAILVLSSTCVKADRRLWRIVACFCLLGSLMETLSLLVFGSTLCSDISDCKVDRGAAINLAASFLWSACGLIVAMYPDTANHGVTPVIDHAISAPPGSIVRTETTAPDGTVQSIVRIVNDDGTCTITDAAKAEIV